MGEATRRQVTGRQEGGPVLPKPGGYPSREWPPEGWPRDGWPPADEDHGIDWLPEEYYNAALWESS